MFRTLISMLNKMRSSVNFECSQRNILIHATDEASIALIDIKLPKNWFADYQCNTPYKLGINIIALYAIIRELKSSDVLIISHNTENRYLAITIRDTGMIYDEFTVN